LPVGLMSSNIGMAYMNTETTKIKVGLAQINNSFSGASYFPYSVGLLQTYAQKHSRDPSRFEFSIPVYKRESVQTAVDRLSGFHIVGFSVYVWNIKLSLAIARRLKAADPGVLIVMGGPQVPDHAEAFLRANPFVDIAVHGEGEQVFVQILDGFPNLDREKIPSISWIDADGAFHTTPKVERLKELDAVPSPYLAGVFDHLMDPDASTQWLALWETNRGCPFSCTFCDWGSATVAKVNRFDMDRLRHEIDWFSSKKIEFIFCCDANFGILPRDLEIAQYVAEVKANSGYPRSLSVQNTKNRVERAYEVQKALAVSGLNKGVTLSLQSVDEGTLKAIRRENISSGAYEILQRRFTKDRIETYSDLILALPGETYDSFVRGVTAVINQGQHNRIQFNNLSILPNAEMGDPEYQKRHGMKTIESRIINIHGSLSSDEEFDEDIQEMQELVVGTNTLPEADWVRVRVFSWMMALLHFDKVFQIPLVILQDATSLPWHQLVEIFTGEGVSRYPTLKRIRDFFNEFALKIQKGGPEYVPSPEWLNIYWPADEYIMIEMVANGSLAQFYAEAENAIHDYLDSRGVDYPRKLVAEAIRLNGALVKLPFQTTDVEVELSHNVYEVYSGIVIGERDALVEKPVRYFIDRTSQTWNSWDDYCREVIWYGNKKGAYLYTNKNLEPQMAGHF
jgi:radical SAM superfamily enzyme YgiQ (UPF0313 family)